jgi:hypothetical protein
MSFSIVPGRYYYPDGQFYGQVFQIVDEEDNTVTCYASKIQAEEKLVSLNTEDGADDAF